MTYLRRFRSYLYGYFVNDDDDEGDGGPTTQPLTWRSNSLTWRGSELTWR